MRNCTVTKIRTLPKSAEFIHLYFGFKWEHAVDRSNLHHIIPTDSQSTFRPVYFHVIKFSISDISIYLSKFDTEWRFLIMPIGKWQWGWRTLQRQNNSVFKFIHFLNPKLILFKKTSAYEKRLHKCSSIISQARSTN